MASPIKIKRSAVPGKIPTVDDLDLGELALNTHDGKLFMKRDNGVASIINITATEGGSSNVYIQESEPLAAGPWIWYRTDAFGNVIDILKG